MSKVQDRSASLSRPLVFLIGMALTGVLAVLIIFCVPKKPDVIADAALPQSLPEPVASADNQDQQGNSPTAVRGDGTGARLYQRFCASCHGPDGRAQTSMAGMMNPKPTNFYSGPWKGEQSAVAIIEVVKNGRGAMPAYGKEISNEAELNALAEHVLSLREAQKK